MSKPERQRNLVLRNLANIVSILGVLPICILFGEHGFQYLLPLIIYNNVMDDLDGVVAAKLNIRSNFGALLDNVCDAIAHTVLMMFVGMHFAATQAAENPYLGGCCLASSLLAAVVIIARSVSRIIPTSATGKGSPTNELIRHVFFVLLVSQVFEFDPTLLLIVTCILHAVSMLAPFKMPYLIRSVTKSAVGICMVNVGLLVAWLLSDAAPVVTSVIAASFGITYLASFAVEGIRWLRKAEAST